MSSSIGSIQSQLGIATDLKIIIMIIITVGFELEGGSPGPPNWRAAQQYTTKQNKNGNSQDGTLTNMFRILKQERRVGDVWIPSNAQNYHRGNSVFDIGFSTHIRSGRVEQSRCVLRHG